MDKQTLLEEIRSASSSNLLSREEVEQAYDSGKSASESLAASSHKVTISTILYYLGGAIIFLGIIVLIYQNWNYLSTPARILVTLGSAIAAYVVGYLLSKYQNLQQLGQAFFLISGLVAPVGIATLLDSFNISVNSVLVDILMFAILFMIYFASYLFFRKPVFMIFTVIFGTLLFHSMLNAFLNGKPLVGTIHMTEYEALVIGISYLLVGYYFSDGLLKGLTGVLYSFGSLGFLSAALALGGFAPEQSVFWELIFPVLCFGIILLSVYWRSKALLVFGSLFLIGYIIKLTDEYFTSSLGWPLALVLAGLAVMGVGYYAFYLNKRYLAKQAVVAAKA